MLSMRTMADRRRRTRFESEYTGGSGQVVDSKLEEDRYSRDARGNDFHTGRLRGRGTAAREERPGGRPRHWRRACLRAAAACSTTGQPSGESAGARPAAGGGQEYAAAVDFHSNQAAAAVASLEASLNAFRQRHPQITVNLTNTPGATYTDKLQTLIAAGTAPDVFRLGGDVFASFYVLKVLAQLDPVIKRDRYNLADFYPSSLEVTQWGKRQYGLPSSFGYRVLFYNADLFQKEGLPLPPAQWNAMGCDIGETIAEFGRGGQIVYGHVQAVIGTVPSSYEGSVDEAGCDFQKVFAALDSSGVDGVFAPAHLPHTIDEKEPPHVDSQYAGNAFAFGYLKGVLHTLRKAGEGPT